MAEGRRGFGCAVGCHPSTYFWWIWTSLNPFH
jgi:hypothetical protein